MALEIGSILRNRYRIDGVLGQGGMGAVYRAFDLNLGVEVAVKENLFTTEEFERQFEREAQILARLRHPNLPRVSDHFVIEGEGQYLVMDFIQGIDIREHLEKEGPISEKVALPWFLDISDALSYLHSQTPPILHRDIKPGNIKIMPNGKAILVDFGLAKFFEKGGATTTGAKAMTPGFSPPEQYGTGGTDPRTDVYSLGATMYAALTATIPEDAIERAMGHTNLTSIRKIDPNITPSVARVIEKALEVKPRNRYQSVAAFASALSGSGTASQSTVVRPFQRIDDSVRNSDTARLMDDTLNSLRTTQEKPSRLPMTILLGSVAVIIAAGLLYMGSNLGNLFNGDETSAVITNELGTVISPEQTDENEDSEETPVSSPAADGTGSISEADATHIAETEAALLTATPTGGGVGQIAYASDKSGVPQIYLINLDGTDERQLTDFEEGACQPAWSPSGYRLAFTTPCLKNRDDYAGSNIWLVSIDVAGNIGNPEPLLLGQGGNFDPAWSPDGKRIAFTSLREGRPQIFVTNLETGDLLNVNDDLGYNYQPTWAPTGDEIMFKSDRGGESSIWSVPNTGGEAKVFSRGEYKDDSNPDWSKDGQFILFVRRNPDSPPNLVIAPYEDLGFVNSRVCVEGKLSGAPMSEPIWSPDGNWIAFETWPDGTNHNIALVSSSCSGYAEITTDPAYDFDVSWRPIP